MQCQDRNTVYLSTWPVRIFEFIPWGFRSSRESVEKPHNPCIELENHKTRRILTMSVIYSTCPPFIPVISGNQSTLCYTCLSICLHVCMSACFLGICEWFDMHICLCVSFPANLCQMLLHNANPSIILVVASYSTTQWALMTKLHIFHHPPNKDTDLLQLDDRQRKK